MKKLVNKEWECDTIKGSGGGCEMEKRREINEIMERW